MELLWAIIGWCVLGLVAGAIARLLVPGRQSMGIALTIVLGIVGSFVGGFIAYLFTGGDPLQGSNWIMSIVGAVIVLGLYVAFARPRRTATRLP